MEHLQIYLTEALEKESKELAPQIAKMNRLIHRMLEAGIEFKVRHEDYLTEDLGRIITAILDDDLEIIDKRKR